MNASTYVHLVSVLDNGLTTVLPRVCSPSTLSFNQATCLVAGITPFANASSKDAGNPVSLSPANRCLDSNTASHSSIETRAFCFPEKKPLSRPGSSRKLVPPGVSRRGQKVNVLWRYARNRRQGLGPEPEGLLALHVRVYSSSQSTTAPSHANAPGTGRINGRGQKTDRGPHGNGLDLHPSRSAWPALHERVQLSNAPPTRGSAEKAGWALPAPLVV
ncbi:hypothetical protein B0J12DRAFT_702319 [Macrophomina phaseolina]|uniref:Uncharacterized protein n=1 Tax=Macrophomina phaseolina TaxID=35725 RepID=A0ABQ8G2A9_9PEZI|nr:hypothetical protein B0J12DRAFT_702319 [Macrophomina phaseolina]